MTSDYFGLRDELRFSGTHLILELWQASGLNDLALAEPALLASAEVAGAALLKMDLHVSSSTGGMTGVAENLMSIHTWPECRYVALDLFMCRDAMPHRAIPIIRSAFSPSRITMIEHKRHSVMTPALLRRGRESPFNMSLSQVRRQRDGKFDLG